MSLQSSQMGTNFSGGNGVFDSYNDNWKQTILKSFNPNKEYNYKIQLNIFKTSKVGIEESGRYREV